MKAEAASSGLRRAMATGVSVLALAGCGESRSSPPGSVTFDRLGVECGDARPIMDSEVVVDDTAPECGEGYCLYAADVARGARPSPGMCSCRCDGDEGTGPFCACSDGFVCREEVRALGRIPTPLAGSYCVPAD